MNSVWLPLRRALLGTITSVLAGAFTVAVSADVQARPLDDVRATKTLIIAIYDDYKPFSWEENGEAKGVDADIGRAIAEKLGVAADIHVRAAGEDVDDDLRANIWQGPRFGAPKADVMLHVPMDRELIGRNNLVAISNAYYHEQFVLAVNADRVSDGEGLAAFRKYKVACEFSTASHYFLAFKDDGAYKNNVSPYRDFTEAIEFFTTNEQAAGIMGRRAQLEYGIPKNPGFSVRYLEPEFPTTLRGRWNIGTAVREDSRDLGYAVGAALDEMKASGELKKIFEKYGLSWIPPSTALRSPDRSEARKRGLVIPEALENVPSR